MTNLEFTTLQSFLTDKVKDQSLIKRTVSIALGLAVARLVPLPSSASINPVAEYDSVARPLVSQMASSFNEQMVVDMNLVEEVARAQWLIRYAHAYPTEFIALSPCSDAHFATKLAGVSHLVNAEIHAFCDSSPELMIVVVNRITAVLKSSQAL